MAALTAAAGLAVVLCVEVGYFRGFLGYVDATGGTAGDYGITYREKARVAKYLAETVPSGHFDLIDASGPIPSPDTYEFLYRMEGGRGVAAWQPEQMGSTSIMTYVVTAPKVRGRKSWDEARAANATKTQIGPMSIVKVRRRVDAGGAAQ
jgi:hypothetical protein